MRIERRKDLSGLASEGETGQWLDWMDSLPDIKYAHAELEGFQAGIPRGAGNHQRKPFANIRQPTDVVFAPDTHKDIRD